MHPETEGPRLLPQMVLCQAGTAAYNGAKRGGCEHLSWAGPTPQTLGGYRMLRFRKPATPSRIFTHGLATTIAAAVVVVVVMLTLLWWAPSQEEDAAHPAVREMLHPQRDHSEDTPEDATTSDWVRPAYPGEQPQSIRQRFRMVHVDLAGRDITNQEVLGAMGRTARHRFVPEELQHTAYSDQPLPIGHEQTISQPYIVALMTQLAEPKPADRALDVGTGSGYQAAVLAELCKEVYGIEIVEPLAEMAAERLDELGYKNVTVRHGDGFRGWPENAPFDVIIVAAAPNEIPEPLIEQLAPGGRLVIPIGAGIQQLVRLRKEPDGTVHRESIIPVRFVPMTGEALQH